MKKTTYEVGENICKWCDQPRSSREEGTSERDGQKAWAAVWRLECTGTSGCEDAVTRKIHGAPTRTRHCSKPSTWTHSLSPHDNSEEGSTLTMSIYQMQTLRQREVCPRSQSWDTVEPAALGQVSLASKTHSLQAGGSATQSTPYHDRKS